MADDLRVKIGGDLSGLEKAVERFAKRMGTVKMPLDQMRDLMLGGFSLSGFQHLNRTSQMMSALAQTGMPATGLGGLGFDLGKLNMPTFNRAIEETQDHFKRLNQEMEKTASEYKKTRKPSMDIASEIDKMVKDAARVFGERPKPSFAGWSPLTAAGGFAGADEMTDQGQKIRRTMEDLTGSMDETKESKDKLDKNLKRTSRTMKRAGDSAEGLAQRIVAMGGKLRSVSRLFFYASLDMQQFANVVLGPMRQGLTIFEEYNKTMTQMRVNFEFMGESGQESLGILEAQFRDLSEATEFSRLEIAKAAAVFGTAGIAVEDISENIGEMARLARINFTTMDQVSKLTLRTMRRFRLSLEEAATEMWRLSAVSQLTGESIFEVANQMGYASELGQELGFTFQEIATHMTLLTEVYGSSSIAGRRLSALYGNLIKKGEEYGIQLRDMNGEMLESRDMIANLADYMDLIADPISQNQYLMQLFGTSGAATARTLLEAFKTGRLDEALAETGDTMIDTMKNLSDTIKDELYVSLQNLRSEVQNLHLAIGQALVPAITDAIGPITNIIQNFTVWVENNRELITTLGVIAVGMTALATVIKAAGFMIEIIVALSTAVVFLGTAATAGSSAILALGSSMGTLVWLGTPLLSALGSIALTLGLVIAVILLLIGAVIGFIKYVTEIGRKLGWLSKVGRILGGVLEFLWKICVLVARILGAIAMGIVALGYVIGGIIGTIAGAITTFLDFIGVLQLLLDILEFLNDVADAVIGFFEGLVDALGPGSPTLAQRFWELGDAVRSTLTPMREATVWGRRLNDSMRGVSSEVAFSYGRATATALQGGVMGREGATIINVDGAYIQDANEMAEIIAERQIRVSKRHYRRTAY